MGLSLFTRASDGSLIVASYTGRKSYCWIWSVSLTARHQPFHIVPREQRRGQWHHSIRLPFRTIIISRQDYHRDPRHVADTAQNPPGDLA